METNPADAIIVVQSRVGSKRLRAKALEEINKVSLIEWVLSRAKTNRHGIGVVLATTSISEDDPLVAIADHLGIEAIRGAELDLVNRFLAVAERFQPRWLIRVCGDNPFVSGQFIGNLFEFWEPNEMDYAYNHAPLGNLQIVDGLGAEIFSVELLREIDRVAKKPELREHVTAAVWQKEISCRVRTPTVPTGFENALLRLDIDTHEDLERIRSVADQFALEPKTSDLEIVRAFSQDPRV